MKNEYIRIVAIIGIIITIVTSLIIMAIATKQQMDFELEKYKIEMQYKYNQINNVEE